MLGCCHPAMLQLHDLNVIGMTVIHVDEAVGLRLPSDVSGASTLAPSAGAVAVPPSMVLCVYSDARAAGLRLGELPRCLR